MNRAVRLVVPAAVLLFPACFEVHPMALADAGDGSGGAGVASGGSGGAGVDRQDGSTSDLVVTGTGGATSGTGGGLGAGSGGGGGGETGSGGRGTGGAAGTGGRAGTGGVGTGGALVTTPFLENFEDGDYAGWTLSDMTDTVAVTTTTAANGTTRSFCMTESGMVNDNWIERDIGPRQPSYVSWWGRAGQNDKRVGYFKLRQEIYHSSIGLITVNFENSSVRFSAGLGQISQPYTANRWYHFEVRNFNWTAKTYDYYIDGVLQRSAIPFNSGSSYVRYIELFNFADAGGVAYWDEIDIR